MFFNFQNLLKVSSAIIFMTMNLSIGAWARISQTKPIFTDLFYFNSPHFRMKHPPFHFKFFAPLREISPSLPF